MSFSYKRLRKRKLKYNINVSPYLIDPDEAKALDEKLVEPRHRAGNFKRAVRGMLTKKKKSSP